MKVLINSGYGGFGLSDEVQEALDLDYCVYNEDFGIVSNNSYQWRADPALISAVEKIGLEDSSAPLAELKVIEIPDDISWSIGEHAGKEWVFEVHRTWK